MFKKLFKKKTKKVVVLGIDGVPCSREFGYLEFTVDNPESFRDISSETTAFALDPSRIYIHKNQRYSRGAVDEQEIKPLMEKLKMI